jgi:gamma-glutamyltranspeptidase
MGFQSVESLHVQIEAKRLAYEDRARYYADPHFAKIPIDWLNSQDYAKERAKLIKLDSNASRRLRFGVLAQLRATNSVVLCNTKHAAPSH